MIGFPDELLARREQLRHVGLAAALVARHGHWVLDVDAEAAHPLDRIGAAVDQPLAQRRIAAGLISRTILSVGAVQMKRPCWAEPPGRDAFSTSHGRSLPRSARRRRQPGESSA